MGLGLEVQLSLPFKHIQEVRRWWCLRNANWYDARRGLVHVPKAPMEGCTSQALTSVCDFKHRWAGEVAATWLRTHAVLMGGLRQTCSLDQQCQQFLGTCDKWVLLGTTPDPYSVTQWRHGPGNLYLTGLMGTSEYILKLERSASSLRWAAEGLTVDSRVRLGSGVMFRISSG